MLETEGNCSILLLHIRCNCTLYNCFNEPITSCDVTRLRYVEVLSMCHVLIGFPTCLENSYSLKCKRLGTKGFSLPGRQDSGFCTQYCCSYQSQNPCHHLKMLFKLIFSLDITTFNVPSSCCSVSFTYCVCGSYNGRVRKMKHLMLKYDELPVNNL